MSLTPEEQEALHRELVDHYLSHQRAEGIVSATWDRTLAHKGNLYTLAELREYLALGSYVSKSIVDWQFMADPDAVNTDDPVSARLLAMGEEPLGHPRRTVCIGGQWFSSHYLASLDVAARLIRAIDGAGIREPRLLEIGGGVGALQALLRRWYGERLTLFAVDLPETLLIQEWRLRNLFPQAPSTYKGTAMPMPITPGGLHFINAHVLASQEIPIDVAINTNSMQEMTAATANGYIAYIQRNMAPGGVFLLENNHGHDSDSVAEPSDYALDGHWRTLEAAPACRWRRQAGIELLRVVLQRTDAAVELPDSRRLALRVIWQSLLADRIPPDPAAIGDTLLPAAAQPPEQAAATLTAGLQRLGVGDAAALVARLGESPLAPADYYGPDGPRPALEGIGNRADRYGRAVWRAQWRLIQALRQPEPQAEALAAAGAWLGRWAEPAVMSGYWIGRFALFMLASSAREAGLGLLRAGLARGGNPFWQVRFAHLLAAHGAAAEALPALLGLAREAKQRLDVGERLHLGQALAQAGDAEAGARVVMACAAQPLGPHLDGVVTRVVAALGLDGPLAARLTALEAEAADPARGGALLDLLEQLARLLPDPAPWRARLLGMADTVARVTGDAHHAIRRDLLAGALGDDAAAETAAALIRNQHSDDFYRLAAHGRLLLAQGRGGLAEPLLERSLALRPGNFKHLEFIGGLYLLAHRWPAAARCYAEALEHAPYFQHIQALHAYCQLPPGSQRAQRLCPPEAFGALFQRNQDIYFPVVRSLIGAVL